MFLLGNEFLLKEDMRSARLYMVFLEESQIKLLGCGPPQ